MHTQIPRAWVTYMTTNMVAVCTRNYGNDFDPKVGEIVDVETLHITRIWRGVKEVSTSDEEKPDYHKPAADLLSLLKEGDVVEDNYCHGRYRIIGLNPCSCGS